MFPAMSNAELLILRSERCGAGRTRAGFNVGAHLARGGASKVLDHLIPHGGDFVRVEHALLDPPLPEEP